MLTSTLKLAAQHVNIVYQQGTHYKKEENMLLTFIYFMQSLSLFEGEGGNVQKI